MTGHQPYGFNAGAANVAFWDIASIPESTRSRGSRHLRGCRTIAIVGNEARPQLST